MSVSMTGRLTSPTSTELNHGPSGALLETTAPKDNGGDGSRFSPTDLCAASLVACAATTLSLYATRSGIPLTGITFEIEKHMTAESPRRIAKLVARFRVSSPCGEKRGASDGAPGQPGRGGPSGPAAGVLLGPPGRASDCQLFRRA